MKSISEIHALMLECLDIDNMEAGKVRLQSMLTDEELKSIRDFKTKHGDVLANINKEYDLGLIDVMEAERRMVKANEDYNNALNGSDNEVQTDT